MQAPNQAVLDVCFGHTTTGSLLSTKPAAVYREASSFGRHQVVTGHDATNQVMLIPCHPRQSYIGSSTCVRTVQPQRHVGQCGPLVFVDGPSIADADRVVHHRLLMALWHVRVRERIHSQPAIGLCHHNEAAPALVKAFHGANHAIDEVVLLVDVSGQNKAQAHIDWHVRGNQSTIRPEACPHRVILLVVSEIARKCTKKAFVAVVEQDKHAEGIDDGGAITCAREERCFAVGLLEDVVNVQACGLVVARPGLVLVA